ncbi:MAG: alpha/beta hydrolase [Tunicatimonas sp.]
MVQIACSSQPTPQSTSTPDPVTQITGPLPLWPNGAPGEPEPLGEEADATTSDDNLVAGEPLIRLANVTRPTITVYHAPEDQATGAVVVVCPGGGYHILAMDLEGTEVAAWLNSLGITAVVLKYRVPVREGIPRHQRPLQDAQRAMKLVRSRAAEWNVDPNRIGVLGFSAGGHLAATLSNTAKRTYDRIDATDTFSSRPNFTVLIYPAYLTASAAGTELASEIPITEDTPPAFLVHAQDDHISVENSLFYYLALKQAEVPAEMHVYATGGHGYGLRRVDSPVRTWPDRAARWLEQWDQPTGK